MPPTLIQHATVIGREQTVKDGSVMFDDRILSLSAADAVTGSAIHADARLLTPGLIDLHTHGVGPYLFERSAEDLIEGLKMLPRFGVTCILPTLLGVLRPKSLGLIERLAAALDGVEGGATAPGFHLEGPFLALAGASALTTPADIAFLKELIAACNSRVRAVSISPEKPGILAVIEHLVSVGIAPFITHTQADPDQTQSAIDAGARHATHFYDVFPMPEVTEPGVRPAGAVEVILADRRATVDFICDGVHVHPAAIRAAFAAKGPKSVIAITDSNIGAGMPDGRYDTPWGYPVNVKQRDAARIADPGHPRFGALAGSSLTMNRAVRNLRSWLKVADHEIWAMATANPARAVNLADRGAIEQGARADLVLWNDDFTPTMTWINGKLVYERV